MLAQLGPQHGALREQILTELDLATAHMSELSARIAALEHVRSAPEPPRPAAKHPARFLRPQAIRPAQGLELNANAHEMRGARHTVDAAVRVLAQADALSQREHADMWAFLCSTLQCEPRAASDTPLLCRLALQAASTAGERVGALALRALRYTLGADAAVSHTYGPHLDVVLSRALVAHSPAEREQALKLVRVLLAQRCALGGAISALACSAHGADPLSRGALETLAELALTDSALLANTGGFAPLHAAVHSEAAGTATSIVHSLLCLTDAPATRGHVWPTHLSSVLIDIADGDAAQQETAVGVAGALLSTWTGLFYVCADERRALRHMVAALSVGTPAACGQMLDMLIALYGGVHPDARAGFLALLFQLIVNTGLPDALIALLQQEVHVAKVRTLVQQLLAFAQKVLPATESSSFYAFPQLFSLLCRFGQSAAGDASRALHSLESAQPPRRVRAVAIDDATFRTLLRDTLVPAHREYSAWNVPALIDLCEGALHDPRRLDDAVAAKVPKRLFSFLRPSSGHLAALPGSTNAPLRTLARAFFGALVATSYSARLLAEDSFLGELRECFEQLLGGSTDAILAPQHMDVTLASTYVDILGVLTGSVAGLELLAAARMFTPLYAMCDADELAPVTERLVRSLDYTHESHPRVFLARVLASAPVPVRLTATEQLRHLITRDGEPQVWAMRLAVGQLFDPVPIVRDAAVTLVHGAVAHPPLLAELVTQRPPIALLGDADHPVFLRILGDEQGYRFLEHRGYVEHALSRWHARECRAHVARAEVVLAAAFMRVPRDYALQLPMHLYGALGATAAGAQRLRQDGCIRECVETVDTLGASDTAPVQLKAAIWALGSVGVSAHGLALLRELGAVGRLAHLAVSSQVISIRATCFYALGLVGSTPVGATELKAHGWIAKGRICVPGDVDAFLTLATQRVVQRVPASLAPPSDEAELHAYAMLSALGNSIVRSSAARELGRLRMSSPSLFGVPLLCRALSLMEHSSMRPAVRRSIWELFDGIQLSFPVLDEIVRLSRDLEIPVDAAQDAQQQLSSTQPRPSYMYELPRMSHAPAALARAATIKARSRGSTAVSAAGSAPRTEWPLRMAGFHVTT